MRWLGALCARLLCSYQHGLSPPSPGSNPRCWILPQMLEAVDECAHKSGMDASALHECAEGREGDELEREAAQQTEALCPPHTYVPWCAWEVDGRWQATDNLMTAISAWWRGLRGSMPLGPACCFERRCAGNHTYPAAPMLCPAAGCW